MKLYYWLSISTYSVLLGVCGIKKILILFKSRKNKGDNSTNKYGFILIWYWNILLIFNYNNIMFDV